MRHSMGAGLWSLFLCALTTIVQTGWVQAQEIRSEVNLAGVDLQENDLGWKVVGRTSSDLPLEEGDIIIVVADQNVSQLGPLSFAAVLEYAQVQNLAAVVKRAGKFKVVPLSNSAPSGADEDSPKQFALGAIFKSLEDTQRVIVTDVAPGSAAERVGLKSYDEILAVDSEPIGDFTTEQLIDRLNAAHDNSIRLRVRRESRTFELSLNPGVFARDSKSLTPQDLPFPLHVRGELAPAFVLPNLEGKSVSLRDFKGKPVLLTFWGTWCRPCLEEADLVDKLNLELRPRLVVLGLNVDDEPQMLRRFLQVRKLSYTVLIAGAFTSPIPKNYDLGALPVTIIINAKGVITYLQAGFPPNNPLESRVRAATAQSDR